eukprot:16445833-Heterocapsa_arctica.AAC.2
MACGDYDHGRRADQGEATEIESMANNAVGNNCGRDRIEQRRLSPLCETKGGSAFGRLESNFDIRSKTNDKEGCYCERRENMQIGYTTDYDNYNECNGMK